MKSDGRALKCKESIVIRRLRLKLSDIVQSANLFSPPGDTIFLLLHRKYIYPRREIRLSGSILCVPANCITRAEEPILT